MKKTLLAVALMTPFALHTLAPTDAHAIDPTGYVLGPREGASVGPLPVDLFTQEEANYYNSRLRNASEEIKLRFRYSRNFLRYCRRVAERNLPNGVTRIEPLNLPERPDNRKWDRGMLFTDARTNRDEGRDIVDVALGEQLMALLQPQPQAPRARPA